MEKTQKFEESTSANFYSPSKKSNVEFPKFQPMKSTFPEIVQSIDKLNDRTCILQMEEQLNLIRKKLRKCQQNIVKISQVEDLKLLIQKMQTQLNQAREKHLIQHSQVKQQIENMLVSLEKQLQNYKKQWERLRVKCQTELHEEIQQIKTQKGLNETLLVNMLKSIGANAREQINIFTQQLKQSRKNRNNKTSKIFAHLQSVRGSLTQMVAQQEIKRSEYNEIIYGLLEKTCENAENSLRRRVY